MAFTRGQCKLTEEDNMNYGQYRQPTAYNGLYKYVAPEGYHWVCGKDDFGRIVYGGYILENTYSLVKEED